jgi:hypothetical protein
MKRNTLSPIGGLQPFLFCIGMYVVALFFSIFVCSSIFYAINPKKAGAEVKEQTANMSNSKPVIASIGK